MIEKVEEFLDFYNLLKGGKTFIAGFSGGWDSTCLLDILSKLSKKHGFKLIALHLNHNWRGIESDEEQLNCRKFCEKRDITFVSEKLCADIKKNETSARMARHEFFEKYYKKYSADGLFLAHTKSDNTETVIYRLVKGTGVHGLSGIAPHNYLRGMEIFRPLSEFERTQIEEYVNTNSLCPNTDSSNFDTKYKRNFIRKEIVPNLKQINQNLDDAVFSLSRIAASQERILEEYLTEIKKKAVVEDKIITQEYSSLSEDVKKRLFYDLIKDKLCEYDFKKVEEIYNFVEMKKNSKTGKTLSLTKDLWLYASSKYIYLQTKQKKPEGCVLIEKEGCYDFNGSTLVIEKPKNTETSSFPDEFQNKAFVSKLDFPLTLRCRKDGDVISPFGMSGKMKLKKFFINKNIPKNERESIILLCKDKEVLWIPRLCLSEKLRVNDKIGHVLTLRD